MDSAVRLPRATCVSYFFFFVGRSVLALSRGPRVPLSTPLASSSEPPLIILERFGLTFFDAFRAPSSEPSRRLLIGFFAVCLDAISLAPSKDPSLAPSKDPS